MNRPSRHIIALLLSAVAPSCAPQPATNAQHPAVPPKDQFVADIDDQMIEEYNTRSEAPPEPETPTSTDSSTAP